MPMRARGSCGFVRAQKLTQHQRGPGLSYVFLTLKCGLIDILLAGE